LVYKKKFSIFCSYNHTALDQGFEGLGPIVPQPNPEIVRLRVGKLSSRARIKGLPEFEILDDTPCAAPYSISNPDSSDKKNNDKKNDSYDNLHGFKPTPYFPKMIADR
jgi:hypothetical protein